MNTDAPNLVLGEFQINAQGDRYFAEINRTTFRDRAASEVYVERFGSDGFREHSLYIVCGTDSGLLPKYLLSKPRLEGTTFLFLERPEMMERVSELLPELADDAPIQITSIEDFLEAARGLDLEHFFYRKALYLVPSFAILRAPHPAYADLAWRAQQELDRISLNLGLRLNNRFFHLTMLRNLAENRTSIHALEGAFAGRTAVVLGAGPSLDEILPWVVQHRNGLDVFAVSRISRRLQQVGIEPDFVFSIDPQSVSFEVGKEMLGFGPQTTFVNNTHACPQLVGQWPWRNLYWGQRLPWVPSPDASPGNTVTHLAVWTSLLLGYSRVLLGGVDLCFSTAGHTHALGSAEREAGPNLVRGAVEVETNRGGTAETDHQMAQGIDEMGQLGAAARRLNARVINLAPDAARIPNVEHSPQSELSAPPHREPTQAVLGRLLPPEEPADRVRYYRQTIEELSGTRRDLRRIQAWARGALTHLEKAFQEASPTAFQKRNRKIDAAEDRIRRAYPELRSTLIQLQASEFTKVLRPKRDDWDPEEIHQASRAIFDGYIRSAGDLVDHLRHTESRLKARIAEESASAVDPARLFRQWEEDQQPGRVHIWRARRPGLECALSDAMKEQIRHLDELFEASRAQERRLSTSLEVAAVRQRSAAMFERGDTEGLHRVIAALAAHPSPEAADLRLLVSGYVAEAEGRNPGALRDYLQVSRSGPREVREDALRRASVVQLRDRQLDGAIDALRELTELNPAHRMDYARVLRLSGRFQEAAQTYVAHLGENPQDTNALLQLGDLYRGTGAYEPARLAYECALALLPDDPAARDRLADLAGERPGS